MTLFYSLEEFTQISKQESAVYCLRDDVKDRIEQLNDIIEPIILENNQNHVIQHYNHHHNHHNQQQFNKNMQNNYKPNYSNSQQQGFEKKKKNYTPNNNKQSYNRNNNNNKHNKSHNNTTVQVTWERAPEFKATKIERKTEGIEKVLQDIRTHLNKLSAKNYETQKENVLQSLREIDDSEIMQKVAQSIFDIASTNRFYSELYSQMYKDVLEIHPVFQETLSSVLQNYINSIKEISPVNAEDDFDEFCAYNKKNDMRRATTVFIVNLMKQSIIPRLKVLSVIVSLQDIIVQKVEEENMTEIVEEITELLFLFLQESIGEFSDVKVEWTWKFKCIPMISQFAKFKRTDKKSISSRAIFKFMDMVALLERSKTPENA